MLLARARHTAIKSPLTPVPCSENATLRCGQLDGMSRGSGTHLASLSGLPAAERHHLRWSPCRYCEAGRK